jgi:hypothetical protein
MFLPSSSEGTRMLNTERTFIAISNPPIQLFFPLSPATEAEFMKYNFFEVSGQNLENSYT